MSRQFTFWILSIGALSIGACDGIARWGAPLQSLYVVTGNRYSEGIASGGLTARFGDLIMIDISNPDGQAGDRDSGFEVGRSYALFIGGERRGDVTIENVTPFQCESSVAVVSTDASLQFQPGAMGLATATPEKLRTHARARRDSTIEEQAQARQLAMEEFSKHGIPDESAGDIQVERLVATEVDASGRTILIGSLSLQMNDAQHAVFLIAETGASDASPQLIQYHRTEDLLDGKDSRRVRFVDQLDLDRDGTDEVVIETDGYESLEFGVYQRQDGSWQQAWVGGQSGC